MRKLAALTLMLLALAPPALALDPLPVVQYGRGFKTWTVAADKPLLKLEDVLEQLRMKDKFDYPKTLKALGIQKVSIPPMLAWPDFVQPIRATAQFLGFERQKMAVLTMPVDGKNQWYAVILRQEGNGEAYWRAVQVFVFDTDPVEGFSQSFPDINGDDIHFWMVHHLVRDRIYDLARADSIFRWDERGRMRLTWQELADAYRPGKFEGQALRLQQKLSFRGDQIIRRTLTIKTYPWMKREEWSHYRSVDAPQAPASKVQVVHEDFAWNPVDFDFYGPRQELTKLVRSRSPFIRREAARRLGEHLKTAPPELENAMLHDKDAYVRIQAALALEAIGDPAALPSVKKALKNWEEPDNVRQALQEARDALEKVAAEAPAKPKPKPRPRHKARHHRVSKPKPGKTPAMRPVQKPKLSPPKP